MLCNAAGRAAVTQETAPISATDRQVMPTLVDATKRDPAEKYPRLLVVENGCIGLSANSGSSISNRAIG